MPEHAPFHGVYLVSVFGRHERKRIAYRGEVTNDGEGLALNPPLAHVPEGNIVSIYLHGTHVGVLVRSANGIAVDPARLLTWFPSRPKTWFPSPPKRATPVPGKRIG